MKFYKLNKNAGMPWYALYPVGGHLFHYQPLAKELNVSVWGTTAKGIDDNLEPLTTVEAIAKDFINSLPSKADSFNLIGYCFGALTTLEISRWVKVNNLILVDPVLDYPLPHPEKNESTPESYHRVRIANREAGQLYLNEAIPAYLNNGKPFNDVDNVLILDREDNVTATTIKQNWLESKNVKSVMQSDVTHLEIIKTPTTFALANQFINDVSKQSFI